MFRVRAAGARQRGGLTQPEERYRKQFDGMPRDQLERVAAAALLRQDELINRASELLGRARDARAAIRGMLEAETVEGAVVAMSHARIVLELPL